MEKYTFTFLLGPKKCGKTVCLKQLWQDYTRAGIKTEYINFKTLNHGEEQFETYRTIKRSIKADKPIIYLLDEVTSLENAEMKLCILASETESLKNENTKVLFVGGPPAILGTWADRAFGDTAGYVYTDFLSYAEYLKYKNIQEVSEKSYLDFLFNAADFHKFAILRDYLRSCLAEAEIANHNTVNCIYDSDVYLLTGNKDTLISIFHHIVLSLCAPISPENVPAGTSLTCDRRALCGGSDNIAERLRQAYRNSCATMQKTDREAIRQAAVFLERYGLIMVTTISGKFTHVTDTWYFLDGRYGCNLIKDFRSGYTMTINHPMFYLMILQGILGKDMPGPSDLPVDLLGSIAECQARALLPYGFAVGIPDRFHRPSSFKKIDYVCRSQSVAVGFAVARPSEKRFFPAAGGLGLRMYPCDQG